MLSASGENHRVSALDVLLSKVGYNFKTRLSEYKQILGSVRLERA